MSDKMSDNNSVEKMEESKTKSKSKLTKIDINKIDKAYSDYPKEFYDWCNANNLTKYPNIKNNNLSARAQGLALLLHNKN